MNAEVAEASARLRAFRRALAELPNPLEVLALAAAVRAQAALMLLDLADNLDTLVRLLGLEGAGVRIYSITLSADLFWRRSLAHIRAKLWLASKLAFDAYLAVSKLGDARLKRFARWLFETAASFEQQHFLLLLSRTSASSLGASKLPPELWDAVYARQLSILSSAHLPIETRLRLAVEAGVEPIALTIASPHRDPELLLLKRRAERIARDAETLATWTYKLAQALTDPDAYPW